MVCCCSYGSCNRTYNRCKSVEHEELDLPGTVEFESIALDIPPEIKFTIKLSVITANKRNRNHDCGTDNVKVTLPVAFTFALFIYLYIASPANGYSVGVYSIAIHDIP